MSNHNDIGPFDMEPGKERGGLPEEKLMAYLEGRLSPEEQREVEQWLAEEGMESDAVEGLQELSPRETQDAVTRLNNQLHHKLAERKQRRKRYISENPWSWLAILIVLVLAVLAFVVIRMTLKK